MKLDQPHLRRMQPLRPASSTATARNFVVLGNLVDDADHSGPVEKRGNVQRARFGMTMIHRMIDGLRFQLPPRQGHA